MSFSRENVHLLRQGDLVRVNGYPAKVLRVINTKIEVEYLDDEQIETIPWFEVEDVIRLANNDGENVLEEQKE